MEIKAGDIKHEHGQNTNPQHTRKEILKMARSRYYLAYGSNLNIPQMNWRCPTAKPKGTGFIEDYELLFKGSRTGSYLTIEKRKGSRVPVAVWEVTAEDEKALDRYEGYPTFYYKANIKDFSYKGFRRCKDRTVDAFVYIMHEERSIGIPTQHYVDVCSEGYETFGFDISFLDEAVNKSYEEITKQKDRYFWSIWDSRLAN